MFGRTRRGLAWSEGALVYEPKVKVSLIDAFGAEQLGYGDASVSRSSTISGVEKLLLTFSIPKHGLCEVVSADRIEEWSLPKSDLLVVAYGVQFAMLGEAKQVAGIGVSDARRFVTALGLN